MKPYQEEYLELLRSAAGSTGPSVDGLSPDEFVAASAEANRVSRRAIDRGTQLLRENLFPLLDNILSASDEEMDSLSEFAGRLMSGVEQKDVGLHYRIHLALMNYARHKKLRDMLIRELYLVGMSLHNLETMLSPNVLRLYTTRMRMCFTESASYFDTPQYDEITDPETRGYIHRSMGNIALTYVSNDNESARLKLEASTRSINILSDPDVRAKTPSLPWDTFLYKSHQERTTLLSYLRSGHAGPEAFAQVLESAQIVQSRQLHAARERGEPLQPRWQYAYMAARYHSGAMLLPDLLDGLYSLSVARDDDDFGGQSLFSHVGVPALFIGYSKQLDDKGDSAKTASRVSRMTKRLFSWIVRAPSGDNNEQMMFYLRQFLYAYKELPGCEPFCVVLEKVFAARHPSSYARMWVAGQVARQLTLWAVDDCPEKLVGLPGCSTPGDVIWKRDEAADFAVRAGRLYDTGMVHFVNLDAAACRELFEEEEELFRLHAYCGAELLSDHESTRQFADIARGHHRGFGENCGYPMDFSPESSPLKGMIYIVAAADAIVSSCEDTSSRYRPVRDFDKVCDDIEEKKGREFAPFVASLIRPAERREYLRRMLSEWRREAYLEMYDMRSKMM